MDKDRLKTIRHLALDMDGTLYLGRTLFEFTPAFLDRTRRLGIGHTFLTNNCSLSTENYIRKLEQLGISAQPEQIRTSGACTIDYLKACLPQVRRVYLLGTPSLIAEFARSGLVAVADDDEPEAVVISFDTALTFERLCKAAWWIRRGKPYVATHPDQTCPTDRQTILVDCGSICAALERSTGRRPDAVLGKPHPLMIDGILKRHGLVPGELAIVGDRLNTDMAMARAAGTLGVLVLTGETTAEDVQCWPHPPEVIVQNVEKFGELLAAARGS
jgi:HAD superfamily hydrolase (TIGR01450 family)